MLRPKAMEADRATPERREEIVRAFLAHMAESPIAVAVDDANRQHYEVPCAFFERVLGSRLKYSACLWPECGGALDEAEERMLSLYAERAQLADGQEILELGCGWGSFCLWAAERYPGSRVTAVSNSRTQREFILDRADRSGLTNLCVVTADASEFRTDRRFDRVVSIEMFEHLRNWGAMFERVGRMLRPGGKLFLHVFVHRTLPYVFPTEGPTDWMGREFFTGGMMPCEDLPLYLQDDLRLEDRWSINGAHYARTLRAWLNRLDAQREALWELLRANPREGRSAEVELQRWRMFLMACEELFAYRGGREWYVGHYRFRAA